jgi:hypothetical protein
MPAPNSFQDALRREIEESHWTYRSLAEALNARNLEVKWQTVHTWANADRKPPPPATVFILEDVLGCTGKLSATMGYQRLPEQACDVPSAVRADPDLLPDQREDLIGSWLAMLDRASGRRQRR